MAMYHFRIKSDKKPNGTKVSAVKHVEYINREGTFAHDELWKQTNKFVNNFITTAQTQNVLNGFNTLLYKTDDFGSIKNSQRGIEVTENASLTTVAIALMLADESMQHKPLIVHGSSSFRKSALTAAAKANLNLSFQDKLLQSAFEQKKAEQDISPELTQSVQLTTKKILENVEKAQNQQVALSHVEYINREKAFEHRGGCIFQAHHLPKWAHDDPKRFFKAADRYEGLGHRRYVEIEFALPNELKSVEQYRQIIDAFIAKHLSNHYFAYAIHNKIGMLSEGQHHPHVHIMFSERVIDDVEKKKERVAKAFFLYPARKKKDGSEPSFEEKWKRGAPKDRKWCNRQYVCQMREDFAQIQNEVLEQNGYSIRVDHRTLQAQKEEAEHNGDSFLARLFSRIPEKYIGIVGSQEDDEPRLERLKHFRALRKQHFDLVMKLDALTKEADELEIKDAVQLSSAAAKSLIDSKEYKKQKFVSTHLSAMKRRMLTAVADVNRWKRFIISQHDAQLQAKLEYMSKTERQIWLNYFELLAQKKHLEEFLTRLKKPDEKQAKELKAYDDLVDGVKAKIFSLFTASLAMKKSVEEIASKLDSPECRKNIQLVTHQILQSNKYALQWLKKASDELDKAVADLSNALFTQTMEEPQTSFKTREVYDLIRRQYHGLKKEYENTFALKLKLRHKIISPKRAMAMAKNIFVHGDFKRLRENIRRYKKAEQQLAKKFLAYNKEEKKFQRKDWKILPHSTFLQTQYYLTKQRTLLELEKERLNQLKFSLQKKQTALDSLCQHHEAQRKIEEIAAGILRKNYKFVRRLEEVETHEKELIPRVNHVKEQMKALEDRVARDKVGTRYRVIKSDNLSNNSAASIIADAILFELEAVQIVARLDGNNLEMEKDWEMMSEFDKDEIIRKKIIREL